MQVSNAGWGGTVAGLEHCLGAQNGWLATSDLRTYMHI